MKTTTQFWNIRGKFLATCLFAVWLLFLNFNTITAPFQRDEGEYAYSAQLLRDGGTPYKESFMQKPPMIIYTYYLAQTVSENVWTPRALALLFIFLTGLILADLIRKEYDNKSACAFLALFPALLFFPPIQAFSAQPEVFLLLPLAASWWSYIRFVEGGEKDLRWIAAAGAFSSVAVLYKPIAVAAILFLLFYILATIFLRKKSGAAIRALLAFSAGAVVSALVVLLPIVVRGGWSDMWNSAFVYNIYYAKIMGFSPPFGWSLFLCTWPLWGLCLWYLIKIRKNRILFFGIFLSLLLGTMGGLMGHYYIITIPALSVIVAVAATDMFRKIETTSFVARKFHLSYIFIASVVALLVIPFAYRFWLTPSQMLYNTYGDATFNFAPLVSLKVREITSTEDTVFIDANEPEILYYAHRKSASRFVITYPLTLPTPLKEKYQDEAISELKARPPEVIIDFLTPLTVARMVKNSNGLDNLEKYLVSQIAENYNFASAIPLEENDGFITVNSSQQLRARVIPYLVIYKKK